MEVDIVFPWLVEVWLRLAQGVGEQIFMVEVCLCPTISPLSGVDSIKPVLILGMLVGLLVGFLNPIRTIISEQFRIVS